MDKLDINFSRKKWKQIYHEIDRNYDDQVSFDEFIFFLFPDNDISMVRRYLIIYYWAMITIYIRYIGHGIQKDEDC